MGILTRSSGHIASFVTGLSGANTFGEYRMLGLALKTEKAKREFAVDDGHPLGLVCRGSVQNPCQSDVHLRSPARRLDP